MECLDFGLGLESGTTSALSDVQLNNVHPDVRRGKAGSMAEAA
jgi:hypothetical protein